MEEQLPDYKNPHSYGNSSVYWTGKKCIEKGCTENAGTNWSPYWCWKHNAERMDRIDSSLNDIAKTIGITSV